MQWSMRLFVWSLIVAEALGQAVRYQEVYPPRTYLGACEAHVWSRAACTMLSQRLAHSPSPAPRMPHAVFRRYCHGDAVARAEIRTYRQSLFFSPRICKSARMSALDAPAVEDSRSQPGATCSPPVLLRKQPPVEAVDATGNFQPPHQQRPQRRQQSSHQQLPRVCTESPTASPTSAPTATPTTSPTAVASAKSNETGGGQIFSTVIVIVLAAAGVLVLFGTGLYMKFRFGGTPADEENYYDEVVGQVEFIENTQHPAANQVGPTVLDSDNYVADF